MTGEEFAKICFAARPVLWAVAIIAVILVLVLLLPRLQWPFGGNSEPSRRGEPEGLSL